MVHQTITTIIIIVRHGHILLMVHQITTIIIIIRHGHILLMVHHTITFVLGLLYIYFWLMARSLFLMVTASGRMMMIVMM